MRVFVPTRTALLLLLCLVAPAVAYAAPLQSSTNDPANSLITVNSPPRAAALVAAEKGTWTFSPVNAADNSAANIGNSDATRTTVSATDVVRWGRWYPPSAGHQIYLRQGASQVAGRAGGQIENETPAPLTGPLLVANVQKIDDTSLTIEPTADGDWNSPLELPRATVAAILFEAPRDTVRRRELEHRLTASLAADTTTSSNADRANSAARILDSRDDNPTAAQDMLLLSNGDRLSGQLIGLVNESLSLKTSAGTVKIVQSKVAALIFRPIPEKKKSSAAVHPAATSEPLSWVGFRDGSRLLARSVKVEGKLAALTLIDGTTLSAVSSSIAELQPIGGRATYLSDLPTAGYRHVPYLSLAWDYRRDRNVLGDAMQVGDQRYVKGLGMHSASRITYDLDRTYERFESEIAIDASAGNRGSVVCRVFTDDGSGAWNSVFESPVIRGGEKPVAVSVELGKAKRISLLVDFSDRGDELDHVDWLDARLVRGR